MERVILMKGTSTEDVKRDEIKVFKEQYFSRIEKNTPEDVKKNPIFDLKNPKSFKVRLTKDLIEKYSIKEWFETYKKEALVSTAGIRGAQNSLYPWDTRFPLNQMGVALATLGKALVLKDEVKGDIHKICSGEVRYNTDEYIEIIRRIQAAQKITTHLPFNDDKTAIWMASYLIFLNDYAGGEYVTSSHAMSSKIATKDLDDQGSQFIPEISAKFVNKIEQVLKKAEEDGYDIEFSAKDSSFIKNDFDGIDEYMKYLRAGVATDKGMQLIQEQVKNGLVILYETIGGCMGKIMEKVYDELKISDAFEWNNFEQDPFFHGIGKTNFNPITKESGFFDYGCDTTILDVEKTMGYDKLLRDKPIGFPVIMVDPDGDRINLGQIESIDRKEKLEELGINFYELDDKRLFAFYMPNQSFFLTLNYQAKQLKAEGKWDDHPRFIITTTPSAATWVEWAENNGVKAVNVPVGFKEIATIMKKVEAQIKTNPNQPVKVHDIYGDEIYLGVQPRLLFAGEESGGMITGPEELIISKGGRIAISMREKSAAEASIICTAMFAECHKKKMLLSEYLEEVFKEHNIKWKYDLRIDRRFYNESNPDPVALKKEKAEGEKQRDVIDDFFLSIALSVRDMTITIDTARDILKEALPSLDFSNLENMYFVGDGTYFRFSDKYLEIRKSGTDAIIKSYAAGTDKKECLSYAQTILDYEGDITPLFKKHIPDETYQNCQDMAMDILRDFQKNV